MADTHVHPHSATELCPLLPTTRPQATCEVAPASAPVAPGKQARCGPRAPAWRAACRSAAHDPPASHAPALHMRARAPVRARPRPCRHRRQHICPCPAGARRGWRRRVGAPANQLSNATRERSCAQKGERNVGAGRAHFISSSSASVEPACHTIRTTC